MIKIFRIFLTPLLFTPSVTFSLLSAEIFPYAIIYSLRRSIDFRVIVIFSLLILSSLLAAFKYQTISTEVFRSISAYANVFFIFFLIKRENYNPELLIRVSKFMLIIFLILGVLQYTSTFSGILGNIISFLVPRGVGEMIGDSRGVSLLASEPSRAAYELLFLYLIVRRFFIFGKLRKLWCDVFLFLYLLLVIKSALGLLYILVLFTFLYRAKFLIFLIFSVSVIVPILTLLDVRAIQIASQALTSIQDGSFLSLFLNASGFRGISVISAYISSVSNPLGSGVGFWEFSMLEALNNSGVSAQDISFFKFWNNGEFFAVRPTAFFASIAVDLGVVGLVLVLFSLKDLKVLWYERDSRAVLMTFLFYTFCLGPIGHPVAWICIAVYINQLKRQQNEENGYCLRSLQK